MTPTVASILLGPILLDTGNLTSLEKTTDLDKATVATLKKISIMQRPFFYFTRLYRAFQDTSSFSPIRLLESDLKSYAVGEQTYAISSVRYLGREEDGSWFLDGMKELVIKKKLAFTMVMIGGDGKGFFGEEDFFSRRLALYCPDELLFTKLLTFIQSAEIPLKEGRIDEKNGIAYWLLQSDESRKLLQPKLTFDESLYPARGIFD